MRHSFNANKNIPFEKATFGPVPKEQTRPMEPSEGAILTTVFKSIVEL